jgi:hypothetical protein
MEVFQHLPGETWENNDKSVRIAGLRAEISIRDFQNTKQQWQPLPHGVRYEPEGKRPYG